MGNSMIRDAEHFKAQISGLEGAGDIGDYILNIVKSKTVPRTAPTAPTAPTASPAPTSPTAEVATEPAPNGSVVGVDGAKESGGEKDGKDKEPTNEVQDNPVVSTRDGIMS